MGLDLVGRFESVVRKIVGMPAATGAPPIFDRMAAYRAKVVAASSDGQKVDLQPENKSIAAQKDVPVRVGVPGLVAIVAQDAVVLLGWEAGDPARPYAVPHWESTTPTKVTFNAQALELAGNAYSLLKTETLLADLSTLMGFLASWVPLVVTAVATAPAGAAVDPGVAAQAGAIKTAITGGAYKSTLVKNG